MTKRYIPPVGSADRAEETDDCTLSRPAPPLHPPECQKCGMGMLVATKEQFAARICGSCERSSTPPSPTPMTRNFRETLSLEARERIKATADAFNRGEDKYRAEVLGQKPLLTPQECETIAGQEIARPASPPPPSPSQEIGIGHAQWIGGVNAEDEVVERLDAIAMLLDTTAPGNTISADMRMLTTRIRELSAPATPSSPETPAELTEALDELEVCAKIHGRVEHFWDIGTASTPEMEATHKELRAANAALVSIYNRQREEIALLTTRLSGHKQAGEEYRVSIAALSSQIERQRDEVTALNTMIDALQTSHGADVRGWESQVRDLEAQLERQREEIERLRGHK